MEATSGSYEESIHERYILTHVFWSICSPGMIAVRSFRLLHQDGCNLLIEGALHMVHAGHLAI